MSHSGFSEKLATFKEILELKGIRLRGDIGLVVDEKFAVKISYFNYTEKDPQYVLESAFPGMCKAHVAPIQSEEEEYPQFRSIGSKLADKLTETAVFPLDQVSLKELQNVLKQTLTANNIRDEAFKKMEEQRSELRSLRLCLGRHLEYVSISLYDLNSGEAKSISDEILKEIPHLKGHLKISRSVFGPVTESLEITVGYDAEQTAQIFGIINRTLNEKRSAARKTSESVAGLQQLSLYGSSYQQGHGGVVVRAADGGDLNAKKEFRAGK